MSFLPRRDARSRISKAKGRDYEEVCSGEEGVESVFERTRSKLGFS